MFSFNVDIPTLESYDGYETGHLSFVSDDEEITSKNQIPSQEMIIFISLTDLLDGLRKLIVNRETSYNYNGCDTSFSVTFLLCEKILTVVKKNKTVASGDTNKILANIFKPIKKIHSEIPLSNFEGAILGDFNQSVNNFEEFLKKQL